MDADQIADVFREMVTVTIRISGPMLLLCMLVGVIVAILQAVTSIHEQSIGFVLKMIVVVLFLTVAGNWILTSLQDFSLSLFRMMLA